MTPNSLGRKATPAYRQESRRKGNNFKNLMATTGHWETRVEGVTPNSPGRLPAKWTASTGCQKTRREYNSKLCRGGGVGTAASGQQQTRDEWGLLQTWWGWTPTCRWEKGITQNDDSKLAGRDDSRKSLENWEKGSVNLKITEKKGQLLQVSRRRGGLLRETLQ